MERTKYPRTLHLPWSPGRSKDDLVMKNTDCFNDKRVVLMEKRDGENTTLTREAIWARSTDSKDHYSRHWVKNKWSSIRYSIPEGWRVCGENLHYTKSIHYEKLFDFFEVFFIFDENNHCLSFGKTLDWCRVLGFAHVPVWGIFPWKEFYTLAVSDNLTVVQNYKKEDVEGYVVRNEEEFSIETFQQNVAKYVRFNHVQTDIHWMHQQLIKNRTR